MPKVDSSDVIRTLRSTSATARLPILVLSGIAGQRQSRYSPVFGANAFLDKVQRMKGMAIHHYEALRELATGAWQLSLSSRP